MLKKIGISLLLVLAILVSAFDLTATTVATASAAACATTTECREIQRAAQERLSGIIAQEGQRSADLEVLQGDITSLRNDISALEATISDLEADIAILEADIAALLIETEENLEILAETEADIEELLDEIARRMRLTQHVNNTNSFLSIFEAESLSSFIRVTRTFNRIALEDAEIMEMLTELVELQEELVASLNAQREQIEQTRAERRATVSIHEAEQANLEETQLVLITRETQLQDELYALNVERISEEEQIAIAAQIQQVLESTPPPSTNTANNPSAPGVPVPSSSGLAHPMPGSIVMSPFGPRNGGHHAGIDLAVPGNVQAPILAAASGVVVLSGWHNSMGWWVIISHDIDGQQVDTVYAHMRFSPPVSVGDTVSASQQIGTKGSTGDSTGPHLHFEIHPGGFGWGAFRGVNPETWIAFR